MKKLRIINRQPNLSKSAGVTLSILCLLLFGAQKSFSQSFHFFKYELPDSNKTSIEALLTLFPDGTATARVRQIQLQSQIPAVYELYLTDSITPENSSLPIKQLIPWKVTDIANSADVSPEQQPMFEFSKKKENNISFYTPQSIQYKQSGNWNKALLQENSEFSFDQVDTNLVKKFYTSNDPYFIQLFGNLQQPGLVSRGGLNEQQKKMKIWMIVVTDLLDEKVGKACARDKENITFTFTNIAKKMGLQPPAITYINAPQFSRQSVLTAISKIKPASTDMVIFYYSGHGYREFNDNSPLPKMILSNDYTFENLPKKSLGIQAIVDSLSKKKSRFNLVINDCCNVECCPVPVPGQGKDPIISPKSIGLSISTENFIKLFLEPKGTVIASSSMPKEYSVGNPEKGGFFTWYLRISLERNLSQYKRDIAWEDIFYEAGKNANYLALTGLCGEENNKRRCIQNPWYDVSQMDLQ